MTTAKICMLGDFGVGKTSLVRRFVDESFSEKYLTTVGVKIDTKVIQLDDDTVKLIVWDVAGSAVIGNLQRSYMQGMAGYLLVCDGTRLPTLETAISLQASLAESRPRLPFRLLVNKSDLGDQTEVGQTDLEPLEARGWECMRTSAKSGDQVEDAFRSLAQRIHHGLEK